MSTNQARGVPSQPIDEAALVQYLQQHPDFFERHPQLLARMRLIHPRNGATISLIERQVDVLREKHQAQEDKLADFVRVARANNALAEKIHRFTRRLLAADDRERVIAEVEAGLRADFEGVRAVLVLAGDGAAADGHFLRSAAAGDAVYQSFDGLLTGGKPRCGQIRDSQRDFLFGAEAANIASVALIPLGGAPALGLLALGSADRDRFHPGMSIEFLTRMGELITDALVHA
jgi:uncharacterized protein YigA (DUF484 family)